MQEAPPAAITYGNGSSNAETIASTKQATPVSTATGAGPASTLKIPLNLKAAKAAIQTKPQPVAQQAKEQTSVAVETGPAEVKSFSLGQLQEHWQAYFIQLKNNNGSPIELMLASAALEIHNASEIRVLLSSSLQEEPFERLKPKVQHYLRQQLQNSQISLQPQLTEDTGPRRLYTNNEKFQHLLTRYPLLGELKERLGLEADF